MNLKSLKDLLIDELHNLLDAEKQLTVILPKILARASSEEIKNLLEAHLIDTHNHVTRLELISTELRVYELGHLCKGMKGILDEAEDVLAARGDSAVVDAAIVAICERIESYEIARYASALGFAELLGSEVMAKYLHQTLAEERTAHRAFVNIAAESVNEKADDVANFY